MRNLLQDRLSGGDTESSRPGMRDNTGADKARVCSHTCNFAREHSLAYVMILPTVS